ncbi:hypothetical protein EO93_02330 [Methanosarcina sp. 1.H.A.2.2]|nr:hypothetical protein EO93_02330 [Methanosarcina sp. 1.H.A.2.2]
MSRLLKLRRLWNLSIQEIMDNILQKSQSEVEAMGVSRSRFQGIKQRIRDGNLNLNTPAVQRLLANNLKKKN